MKIITIVQTASVFTRPTVKRDFAKGQCFVVLSAGDAAPKGMELLTHAEAEAVEAAGIAEVTDGDDPGAGSLVTEISGFGPGGQGGAN